MVSGPIRSSARRRLAKHGAAPSGSTRKTRRAAPFHQRKRSRRGNGGPAGVTPESPGVTPESAVPEGGFNPLKAPEATRRHAIAYQYLHVHGAPSPSAWWSTENEAGTIREIQAALKMKPGSRHAIKTVLENAYAAKGGGCSYDPGRRGGGCLRRRQAKGPPRGRGSKGCAGGPDVPPRRPGRLGPEG